MSASAQNALGLQDTGTTTTVAPDKIARLMYYLRCCLWDCGLDILPRELLDYRNYQNISVSDQDAVLVAALEFAPSELLDKVIFLDKDGSLCAGTDNKFLQVTSASQFWSVHSHVVLGNDIQQVSTVMVFRRNWLRRYYIDPLRQCAPRHSAMRDISSSNHCVHCPGLFGICSCTLCPSKRHSDCISIASLLGPDLADLANEIDEPNHGHCDHCLGIETDCTCQFGCPLRSRSRCTPVVYHIGVACEGPACEYRFIKGTRFHCLSCPDYNLCESCYYECDHDDMHVFEKIERPGTEGVRARHRRLPPTPPAMSEVTPTHTAESVPERGTPSPGEQQRSAHVDEFYLQMPSAELKMYLDSYGVDYTAADGKRALRRLVWETCVQNMSPADLDETLVQRGAPPSLELDDGEKRQLLLDCFRSSSKHPRPEIVLNEFSSTTAHSPSGGDASSSDYGNEDFYRRMSPSELICFLDQHGVEHDEDLDHSYLQRLVWETHVECMGLEELDETLGRKGLSYPTPDIASKRRLLKNTFPNSKPDTDSPSRRSSHFRSGSKVVLVGLQSSQRNGRTGTVTLENENGRVYVHLDGTTESVAVRPENVRLAIDAELVD